MTSAGEHATPVWPRWEVQGYGTVNCDTPPGGRCELAPDELVPPWVDIRLTFADGARVDVLAVQRDGVIAVEDAQAAPPLPLDELTELGAWIEAPLAYARGVVAGQHHVEAAPFDGGDGGDGDGTTGPVAPGAPSRRTQDTAVAVVAEDEGTSTRAAPRTPTRGFLRRRSPRPSAGTAPTTPLRPTARTGAAWRRRTAGRSSWARTRSSW